MIDIDTKEFERVLSDLASVSRFSDKELVKRNAKEFMWQLVAFTPYKRGYARAGWWDAWVGVGRAGSPRTRRSPGEFKLGKRLTYIVEGGFLDRTGSIGQPYIEVSNNTRIRLADGTEIPYLELLNLGKLYHLKTGKPIGLEHQGFIQKALNATTFKFLGIYERQMKKRSA